MHPYAMASGGANGTHMPKMIVNAIDNANHCAGCQSKIADRYLLEAMGKYWHEDCLKCTACSCRLGEVGSTLYFKEEMLLCKRDYLRIFGACARTPVHPAFCGTGQTGNCAACHQKIPAFEMVMRARQLVYHLDCFACQQCESRFCVGDRFYLCDGKILCQYDYDERMMFAQMAVAYQQQQVRTGAHSRRCTCTHAATERRRHGCT
jgi:hypothetical protein